MHPFSMLTAFGVCISSFNGKIICEWFLASLTFIFLIYEDFDLNNIQIQIKKDMNNIVAIDESKY